MFDFAGIPNRIKVPFSIKFPTGRATPMEISALTPSVDGVALLTVTDVRFGDGAAEVPPVGANYPCADPAVDFVNTYDTSLIKTGEIGTFMQKDAVTADMGFFVNSGWALKRGIYNASNDDAFLLAVEVEMSDHPATFTGEKFNVYLAVKFGSNIVVSKF